MESRERSACGVHAHGVEHGRLADAVPAGEKRDPAKPANAELLDSEKATDRQVPQVQPVARHAGTSAVSSKRGASRWRVACSKA